MESNWRRGASSGALTFSGEIMEGVDIRLRKQGTVSVTVKDTYGNLVPAAITLRELNDFPQEWDSAYNAETATFNGVNEGNFSVEAHAAAPSTSPWPSSPDSAFEAAGAVSSSERSKARMMSSASAGFGR